MFDAGMAKLRVVFNKLRHPSKPKNDGTNGAHSAATNGHVNGNGNAKGVKGKSEGRDFATGGTGENALKQEQHNRDEQEAAEADGASLTETESAKSIYEEGHGKPLEDFLDSNDPPEIRKRYGALPLVQSYEETEGEWTDVPSINPEMIGQEVYFRARMHVTRNMSAKLVFLLLRSQVTTLQGVLRVQDGIVSEAMVRWAEHIRTGSIIMVRGVLKQPHEPITGASIQHVEVDIQQLHLVSERKAHVPFNVYEAETNVEHEIPDHTRLNNRVIDLRTPTSQAIFRVQSAVCGAFRRHLEDNGFLEIHTPKLQGGATEGGATVFKVDYFGRPAFLAQSPQLAKQMCIAADFGRVFEIGPVFRAENSNDKRHMTEFVGLDIEMAIRSHYHEMMRAIDGALKAVFEKICSTCKIELDAVQKHYPSEKLVWLEETKVIQYADGVKLLQEDGWTDDDGNPLPEDVDLPTPAERRLGEIVKEKYGTDYYILDKFPTSVRPFYTMLDPHDPKVCNSFDIFVRGQEICSAGQRIHDSKVLLSRLKESGMDPEQLYDYVKAFKWVAPPRAGAGIGLERLVSNILQLENLKLASLFPRDPKSFPYTPGNFDLRDKKANTLKPKRAKRATLEELIANYGDSSNTSWTEEAYKIWRDKDTGAAMSYVLSKYDKYAIVSGDPLCDPKQFSQVIERFLDWMRTEQKRQCVFVLVGGAIEEILSSWGWNTVCCAAEQRLDLTARHFENDAEFGQKVRHAKKEGVKIHDLENDVPKDIMAKIDARIEDWKAGRTGQQVHISNVTPWMDMTHRHYLYAEDGNGKICGLVVLAQLAIHNGYQIKWAMDFPDAPNGAIEYIIIEAMRTAADLGVVKATFGGGATERMTPGKNIGTTKGVMLDSVYQSISKKLKLTQKSDFRAKFKTIEDPVWVAFPPKILGPRVVKAVVDFFEESS